MSRPNSAKMPPKKSRKNTVGEPENARIEYRHKVYMMVQLCPTRKDTNTKLWLSHTKPRTAKKAEIRQTKEKGEDQIDPDCEKKVTNKEQPKSRPQNFFVFDDTHKIFVFNKTN